MCGLFNRNHYFCIVILNLNTTMTRLYTIRALVLSICILCCLGTDAYNIRQTSNSDGLASSAVLAMAQDSEGFLWIGTLDGISISDGSNIFPFSTLFPEVSLSGNLIENIIATPGSEMWIHTNHGLDRFNFKTRELSSYSQFNGQELVCAGRNGGIYVLDTDSRLFYLPSGSDDVLKEVDADAISYNTAIFMQADNDTLTVFGSDGVTAYGILHGGYKPRLSDGKMLSDAGVAVAHGDDSGTMVIGTDDKLRHIARDGNVTELFDLRSEIARRGKVSDVLRDSNGDIYISFESDGVVRGRQTQTGEYRLCDIGLKAGVFCLEKSATQPVVWIGSDCEGLYACFESPYMIRSYDFSFFDKKINHPIRALYLDNDHTLWIGTKGSGVLRMADFDTNTTKAGPMELFTTSNSALGNNSVFAFAGSRRPLLWLATDNGIDYYSYPERRLKTASSDPVLQFIHGIHEENDSTLWVSTVGNGIVRCRISGSATNPSIEVVKVYQVDDGKRTSNYFFDMDADSQGRLLFANRGLGAFEIQGDSIVRVPLEGEYDTKAVLDVFSVVNEDSVRWLGTGHGLLKVSDRDERLFFGLENGFINNTIHDMLNDNDGKLWISTNNGLYRFDQQSEKTQVFGRPDGVKVTEFSDGAAFNTGSMLLFGGINGLVTVSKTPGFSAPQPYRPMISLQRLAIAGENVDPTGYIRIGDGGARLELAPGQNHFAVTFATPDFLNPSDYNYLYTLDGREWINNGSNGTIFFNEMSYGKYNLRVKYVNRISGVEGEPYRLEINLKAPWYLSDLAKVVYILLILTILGGIVLVYIWRQRRKRAEELSRIEHQHREEVYEEKLRFFTNITHEFCTPLTLIYGPCERIMDYEGTDDYIKKYIGLVRTNVERLNTLIQELIDFRRIETGHKILKIRPVNISELCSDTVDTFSDLADRNDIDYAADIEPSVIWNTDFSSLRKILNNLISNAFKYTPVGGRIEVDAHLDDDDKLRISVYNTGKGIGDKDRDRIFNRYSVLDNVEENAVKGLSARNGLGMAICHSMVKMLHGDIDIESEVGRYARFIVTLPHLESDVKEEDTTLRDEAARPAPRPADPVAPDTEIPETEADKSRSTVLVIDDNTEILSLLADSLSDYQVRTATSAEEGLTLLKQETPDVIITDIMMPGTDGLTFARQIKTNRHTMHIPLIILSAKTSNEEKVEGIASGADVFIGKPFSVAYLRAVVARLLESRNTLREYYNSSASAFEYADGQLLDRDDKDFLDRVVEYIDAHIDDPDLSPDQLAAGLQMSLRNLYRRFKELDQPTPNYFIKNHRIAFAAKLLLTTSYTVQEIIYRTGFSNRSHFYKEFDKRYGMTPKDYRQSNKKRDASFETTPPPADE